MDSHGSGWSSVALGWRVRVERTNESAWRAIGPSEEPPPPRSSAPLTGLSSSSSSDDTHPRVRVPCHASIARSKDRQTGQNRTEQDETQAQTRPRGEHNTAKCGAGQDDCTKGSARALAHLELPSHLCLLESAQRPDNVLARMRSEKSNPVDTPRGNKRRKKKTRTTRHLVLTHDKCHIPKFLSRLDPPLPLPSPSRPRLCPPGLYYAVPELQLPILYSRHVLSGPVLINRPNECSSPPELIVIVPPNRVMSEPIREGSAGFGTLPGGVSLARYLVKPPLGNMDVAVRLFELH
jgi:hypothetical protein